MEWGLSHGRFAEICEHSVYLGGDAERLAPVSAWRLMYRASCPACRNGRCRLPRSSTLAGGSCSLGRQQVLGTWVHIVARTSKALPPAAPSFYRDWDPSPYLPSWEINQQLAPTLARSTTYQCLVRSGNAVNAPASLTNTATGPTKNATGAKSGVVILHYRPFVHWHCRNNLAFEATD